MDSRETDINTILRAFEYTLRHLTPAQLSEIASRFQVADDLQLRPMLTNLVDVAVSLTCLARNTQQSSVHILGQIIGQLSRKIRRAKAEMEITILRAHNANTPLNRNFPNELMAATFAEACSESYSQIPDPLKAICQVCHLWRDIALNSATLWTDISYRSDVSAGKITSIEKIRAFIARSRSALITMEIEVHGEPPSHMQELASLLIPHLYRCRHISFNFSRMHTAQLFLPLPSSLPALNSLSVMLGQESDDLSFAEGRVDRSLSLFMAERADSSLTSLNLFAPQNFVVRVPDFEDLSRLSALSLAVSMPPVQMLRLAACAPKLRSFDLMAHQAGLVVDGVIGLTFPRLERQRIAGDGWTSLMRAPSLRSLTLVDQASLDAVDRAMEFSPRKGRVLYPLLQNLTLMTPEPADLESSSQFRNLARFIGNHADLLVLDIMACWSPIARILDLALSPRVQTGATAEVAEVPCPKLGTIRLNLVYPVDLLLLLATVRALLVSRPGLRIEFTGLISAPVPDLLTPFLEAFPERATLAQQFRTRVP